MKICSRCVLPESFPGITFSEEGVCQFCQSFEGKARLEEKKSKYLDKFNELIAQVRDKGDYDCTLSFSGGKDSTYTLYILKKKFKLRVLALTLDNGFLSRQAVDNIQQVVESLGVDSLIFKPDFKLLKSVFRTAAFEPMYPAKTLERASTICTSCIGLVKFIFLKIAIEKKIPIMAWGWSPGQAPLRSSLMKINPTLFRSTQDLLRKPMVAVAGDGVNRYFLENNLLSDNATLPYNVSPLAFLEYDEAKIFHTVRELGWKAPQDVDRNSTNCLLNSLANKIHMERYGFHPYAFEIAEMVRKGIMTREEGLQKIEEPGNDVTITNATQKLDLNSL